MDVRVNIEKIKQLGFRRTVKMIFVKWKKRENGLGLNIISDRKKILDKIFQSKYKRVIIFENHFGYHNIMMQRPQHLLKNLGDEETLVFYNSYYDVDFQNRSRIVKISSSVYIIDLYYFRRYLFELVKYVPHKYLCIYSTDTIPFKRIEDYLLREFRVIYEYVDDINAELINPKKISCIETRHEKLLREKNVLTVVTADRLYENIKKKHINANVFQISNGVECECFQSHFVTENQLFLRWIRDDKIKVGYYGALASWVDYELLKYLAHDDNLQIILIGVEHDDSLNQSGLLKYENVKFFGKKPYKELAGYVHYFDICIIPFLINKITVATSPVKLFEYMSMEKPIVSTALPECCKYDMVHVAHSAKEFSDFIYKSWVERDDKKIKEKLKKCALGNDWREKAYELKQYLLRWEDDER